MNFFKSLFPDEKLPKQFSLPTGTVKHKQFVSPDSKIMANIVQSRLGFHIEINGKPLKTYDFVTGVTISQDSKNIAYTVCSGNKWKVIFNNIEYAPWDDIGKTSPVISPDSQHIAYAAKRGNYWFAVLDKDIVGGPYDGFSPGGIVFSPDSKHIAYAVRKGGKGCVVVDGKERMGFPYIIEKSWIFSPDSRRLGYVAGIKGEFFPGKFIGEVSAIIDEKILQSFKSDGENGLSNEIYFSPDSEKYAYSVTQNGESFFIINDVPQKKYKGIVSGRSMFWQDNDHRAAKASWQRGCLTFSPDSRHFAYAASDGNAHVVIHDGEEIARYESVMSPVQFSPDSQIMIYSVDVGDFQFLAANGDPLKKFYGIPPLEASFSPDSKHLGYFASQLNSIYIVVDGITKKIKGVPVFPTKVVWDNNRQFHFMRTDENKIYVEDFILGEDWIEKIETDAPSSQLVSKITENKIKEQQSVLKLLEQLDKKKGSELARIEKEIIDMGEDALEVVLGSIDEINQNMFSATSVSRNAYRLGLRIRLLGKSKSLKQSVLSGIGGALADSSVFLSKSPFPVKEIEKLKKIATEAFLAYGEVIEPYLRRQADTAKYPGDDPMDDKIVRVAFGEVLNRSRKKWWEFWK